MLDTPGHQEGNEELSLLASEPTNRDDDFFAESFNGVKPLALDNPGPRQGISKEEHDGPLFLALLTGNNNLNDAAQKGANQPQPVPDTLDPRLALQAQATDGQAIPGLLRSKLIVQELISSQTEEEDDGPLLLALLMGNNNNNNNNNNNAAAQPAAIQPAPDTLDPRSTLEAQAIPNSLSSNLPVQELIAQPQTASPVLRLRGLSSESHHGGLNEEKLQFWRDEGYLVVPDALSRDCVAELLRSVNEIADILANADDKRVKSHTYDVGQDYYVSPVGRVLAVPSKRKPLRAAVNDLD